MSSANTSRPGVARETAPDEARPPLPGLETGKYRLLTLLGRGGMADVYLALLCGFGGVSKVVVVKRLREEIADDESFRRMFLDEARLAARLRHPNIVDTYEVDEQDGAYFIAMEYLEGQALSDVMKVWHEAGALDAPTSARIMSDVLKALHHAHELADFDRSPLNIVHRDVSPHNVFITCEGEVKLVDFGIAKASKRSAETDVGIVKGKMMYMAPEQALGTHVDRRADVFPAGIILWELLTGRRLMEGDVDSSSLHKLLNLPIPRVSSVDPDIDPALDAIVARSLERDCDLRYATAFDMAEELDFYLARCPPKNVADLMTKHFGVAMDARRAEIREAISGAVAGRMACTPPELSGVRRGTGSVSSGATPGTQDGTPQGASFSSTNAGATSSRNHRALTVAAFIGVAALAWTAARLSSRHAQPVTPNARDLGTARASGAFTASPATLPPGAAATGAASSSSAPAGQGDAPPVAGAAEPSPARLPPEPKGRPAKLDGVAGIEAPKAAGEPVAMGFVTIDTSPWTRVVIDGRVRGTTPLVRAPLPAGTHAVLLENPEQGISRLVSIEVSPGQTTVRRIPVK
jgi:eukaryotic-like serine/threonine-protein kinase